MRLKTFTITFIISFCSLYSLLGIYTHMHPRFIPNIAKENLDSIINKDVLSDTDYETLYNQTGLTKPIIDELKIEPDFKDKIHMFQENYLKEFPMKRIFLPPVTITEELDRNEGGFELAPYKNGYILLTKSTHTANWRHGHCGIVVDEVRGLTLEALNPGSSSIEQPISKWKYFPTMKMYRLKDASQSLNNEIAEYALSNLKGLPYNILSDKDQGDFPHDTHCSLLIWQAFKPFGFDLDSTGELFVSPKNLAMSPHLELLQTYGFDPKEAW